MLGLRRKKLYKKFLSSWELAYVNYYERIGRFLGDTATDDNSGTRDGHIANAVTATNIEKQLEAVGLEPPSEGPTGSSNVRRYAASDGTQYDVTINFRYRSDDMAGCLEIHPWTAPEGDTQNSGSRPACW